MKRRPRDLPPRLEVPEQLRSEASMRMMASTSLGRRQLEEYRDYMQQVRDVTSANAEAMDVVLTNLRAALGGFNA